MQQQMQLGSRFQLFDRIAGRGEIRAGHHRSVISQQYGVINWNGLMRP